MQWYKENDARCYWGGANEVYKYNSALSTRREFHPATNNNTHGKTINSVNQDGYCVMKQAFNKEKVLQLREHLDSCIKAGINIKRKNEYEAVVNQPLYNLDLAAEIAFDDLFIDIATEYFGCSPALGTVNLRRSFVNDLPEEGTQLFHCDKNSVKFIKFFLYLNDVDVNTGPHCYVEGSNHNKFEHWQRKYRWNYEEIQDIYGEEKIKYLTGKPGDVIVATTTGFHRGAKPVVNERDMYTINYVIHPEFWVNPEFKIKKDFYDALSESKKPVADFLIKV